MAEQRTDVDPEKAIANITKGPDKKEDLMLIMTANAKWDQFFTPAPLSIALLGELLVISADRDITLRDRCPDGGFKHLKYPDSLRTCLLQIANRGWSAFNNAHKNMDQIRLHTSTVETHIKYAVRILLGGTAKEIEHTLPLALSKVSEIADICKALAKETENKFLEVMDLTGEALEACESAKGHYKEKDKKTEIELRVAREQKALSEESKKKLDEHYQKMEREFITAKEEFDSAVKEMPSTAELAGAFMVEGIFDIFKCTISSISAQKETKESEKLERGNGNHKQRKESANEPKGDIIRVVSIIKGMQILFKEMRPNMNVVANGSALECQQRLTKEKERLDKDSSDLQSDLMDCIDEANDVCSDLIDYTKHGQHDDKEASKIKKIHDRLQNRVQTIEARIKRKHGYPIESTPLTPCTTSKTSLIEAISVQPRFKVEMAKQNLAEARREREKSYQEMKKESDRLRQTLVDLQKLDLTKMEFDEILETLRKGIRALSELREQWGKLCEFFQMISNLIKCCLHSSLKCFVDYSGKGRDVLLQGERMSNVFRKCIIELATEANRVAYVVQSISSLYVEISSNYLMDGITSLGKLLPLDMKNDKAELIHKREQLQEEMKNAQNAISAIMEKNQKQFDERIAERVKRIKTEVEAFLPPLPEERIKEIRDSVQDAFITDPAELDKTVDDYV